MNPGDIAALAPGRPHGFDRWCRALLNWTPHAKQEAFGNSPARILLLICGIRFGKSDVAAARFLHQMFFTPGGRFLNASFSQDQANIVVQRAYDLAANGPLAGFVEKFVHGPHPMLVLKNGASVQARSTADANLLRGRAYHGINLDEGGFSTRDDAMILLGRVIDYAGWVGVTSTPPPMKNWLFEWWVGAQSEQMRGDPHSFAMTGTTYDNARIPITEIDALRERYTELGFQREVMGEFVDNEGATFPMEVVNRIFADYVPEADPIRDPATGKIARSYVTAWDLGRKTTVTSGITLDNTDPSALRGVAQVRLVSAPWPRVFEAIEREQAHWNSSVMMDGTGLGDVVYQSVNVASVPFIFNPKTRTQGILQLQKVTQTPGAIILPLSWHQLRTQLMLHTWKEDAEDQTWDDFDSLLMAVHMAVTAGGVFGFSSIR